jgi:hypothetical protein
MKFSFSNWFVKKFSKYLLKASPSHRGYLCDFSHIQQEVQMGDVLLIEGRNRVSEIIRTITQSPWTHAVLYIGHPDEIESLELREMAKRLSEKFSSTQLIIETDVGIGTVISPIEKYNGEHIRILRPVGLGKENAQKVITFALKRLGAHYNIRHTIDLARFLFPWSIFPRRWRSSLFQYNALKPTQEICSSMIASAFASVNFPVLPMVREDEKKNLELINRNPNIFTPSDFDYSPYFAVIKYPILPYSTEMPWRHGVMSDE